MGKMKVVVEVSEKVDRMREAINKGGYEDSSQFVNTAIQNQIKLELDDGINDNLKTLDQALVQEDTDSVDVDQSELSKSLPYEDMLVIPENDSVQTISLPNTERLDSGPLWGQYNRIFPVKLTLRVLTNMLSENFTVSDNGQKLGGMISLGEFGDNVAEIARNYGMKIKAKDEEYSRTQGERLSAALPIGDDPEKSEERFKTHFVGRAEQGGDLTGAAPHMMFVNMPADNPGRIGLTEPGLEFATIRNPLLDDDVSSDCPLSEEEVVFYMEHIAENRLAEFTAMQSVATAIQNDENRPDDLTEHVASINADWSYSQARTVRSGLVSRMFELGLVRRERIGQRGVQYELTDGSEEVLNLHE
jgi:molybdenum-dependent DNA-binding transcriptional regulator ModE/Arc/MetJ-type ribon-helix-helix transcriptional regulator